jgi:hypothetical protein
LGGRLNCRHSVFRIETLGDRLQRSPAGCVQVELEMPGEVLEVDVGMRLAAYVSMAGTLLLLEALFPAKTCDGVMGRICGIL